MSAPLVILGKGNSRHMLAEVMAAHPDAILWTLNDIAPGAPAGWPQGVDIPATTSAHFDIHHDRRFSGLGRALSCPFYISPFLEPWPGTNEIRFPLEEIHRAFNVAYFESSFCYILALAAYHTRASGAFSSIHLPGVDMLDGRHCRYRFGAHFWLGALASLGVDIVPPASSTLLRRINTGLAPLDERDYPHAYGQPESVTAPVAARYRWA